MLLEVLATFFYFIFWLVHTFFPPTPVTTIWLSSTLAFTLLCSLLECVHGSSCYLVFLYICIYSYLLFACACTMFHSFFQNTRATNLPLLFAQTTFLKYNFQFCYSQKKLCKCFPFAMEMIISLLLFFICWLHSIGS